jgi:transcriptional regulator with XRE-family HTH domain
MDQDWMRLADAIRQARQAAGMTQVDLADKAGIAEGSVQNLESGRTRNRIPQSLAKVEAALGWAVGSGVSILRGAAGPVTVEPIGGGHVIARLPEAEVQDAVTLAAIAVTDGLTAREIRELSQRVIEDLKQRGLL